MLEFPEVQAMAAQLERETAGKLVTAVLPPNKKHKFCWFQGEPEAYETQIKGSRIVSAAGFGIYVELCFDNGRRLCINDGVNVRLLSASKPPKSYQLVICLEDGQILAFSVAMYGGIILHDGSYDNEYYLKSLSAVSPLSAEFPALYDETLAGSKPNLSVKAFLATEQRFPGIGNGVLQDILFDAGLHPKRKLAALSPQELETLKTSVVQVLGRMTEGGGRDTEKDLYGQPGGYRTRMSKLSYPAGCPACGGQIIKEAYLGGSVYYCPACQPFVSDK